MQLKCELVVVFQKWMHLSAVPPPEARSPCMCGDHAIAFTAAVCSLYFNTGWVECWFQTNSCVQQKRHLALYVEVLEGNYIEEKNKHIPDYHFHRMPIHGYHKTTWDHKPKSKWTTPMFKIWGTRNQNYHSEKQGMNLTSDLWPLSLLTKSSWARISRWRILLSRLPEDNNDELQASAPTRRRWPSIILNLLQREASQILKEQFQNNK